MNWLQITGLLLGTGGSLVLAGYWLAAEMSDATPAERLAAASLAGLGSLLLMISAVGCFAPIRGFPAWLCLLLPWGLSLGRASIRRRLVEDCGRVLRQPAAPWVALGAAALWMLLLWPMLRDPGLVFYDGSPNHDNFFWIAHAEYLLRHSYLSPPVVSATQPFFNTAGAIVGWQPAWGRLGAEGFLALASGTTGLAVIRLYEVTTAALLVPWLGGVFLLVRGVVRERPRLFVWGAAAALQPVFVFFHGNGNLANLMGALTGAAVIVGVQRGLRRAGSALPGQAWWGLAALGTHGLLCGYPEMLPFVLLPVGLLGVRAWWVSGWRPVAWLTGALTAGGLINPVTTLRAVHGFLLSFGAARADEVWGNLFSTLQPAEYFPALTTQAILACQRLGFAGGVAISLGLLGLLALTVRRARDPFGTAVLLAGAGALLGYTLLTGFNYGWQKTTQFAGVCVGALFPAGGLTTLDGMIAANAPGRTRRWLAGTAVGMLLAFFTLATLDNGLSIRDWAVRKGITNEMLSLRAVSATRLRGAPVLVLSESFKRPFFYGMWASYLLLDSSLIFSVHDPHPGGSLEDGVLRELPGTTPAPAAILVSRGWAETFDAASTRLSEHGDLLLLTETNRVSEMRGFYPDQGFPKAVAAHASLRLQPPRDAWLHLTLRPRDPRRGGKDARLGVEHRADGEAAPTRVAFDGGPPWTVSIPLRGGVANTVSFAWTGADVNHDDPQAFRIEALRVTTAP